MNTSIRLASGALIVVLCSWVSAEEAAEPDRDRIRNAAVRGLRIVQKSARSNPENRSCLTSHKQTLPQLAMATARHRRLEIDHDVFREQLEFTHESFAGRVRRMQEGEGVGGASLTVGYGLWALEIGKWKKDETTAAMVSFLLKKQAKDGSWKCSSNRPPLEESSFTCSILAVYYMGKFATETQRERVDAAAARAREWVLKTAPRSHEDLVSRLGALPLVRAEPDAIVAARKAVLDGQREDGGWAQLDDMKSDAYATGFTLFTLQRIGFRTDHPVYQRGVKFLLETQCEDGSWFVKTRSKPIQVFFDNGDPHGKHQFISIPATSWATTALALALPAPRRARF